MLKHVLVPLDGSALSEQALDYAENIIAPNGHLILLSVLEIPTDYEYAMLDVPMTLVSARQFSEEEYNSTYRRVQDYLTNFARRLTAKGYSVECVVESGEPSDVINKMANAHHAEAIVMTTHGRTGLNRWIFGSVTQKVISHMECPVVVVPGIIPEKIEAPMAASSQIPATS